MDSMRLFDALDRVEHRHGENDWHSMQAEDPTGGLGLARPGEGLGRGKGLSLQVLRRLDRIALRADDTGSVP